MNEQQLSAAAAALGRRGGQAKSRRKTAAVRLNARKGGWPKGRPRKPKSLLPQPDGKPPLQLVQDRVE